MSSHPSLHKLSIEPTSSTSPTAAALMARRPTLRLRRPTPPGAHRQGHHRPRPPSRRGWKQTHRTELRLTSAILRAERGQDILRRLASESRAFIEAYEGFAGSARYRHRRSRVATTTLTGGVSTPTRTLAERPGFLAITTTWSAGLNVRPSRNGSCPCRVAANR